MLRNTFSYIHYYDEFVQIYICSKYPIDLEKSKKKRRLHYLDTPTYEIILKYPHESHDFTYERYKRYKPYI